MALTPKPTPPGIKTLPNGASLITGTILSVCIVLPIAWLVHTIFGFLFPHVVAYSGFIESLVTASSLLVGALGGLSFFFGGRLSSTPIGYKGVPTFFGGRPKHLRFLYLEGENWGIPLITGVRPVDMRGRPLIEKGPDPSQEEIQITAQALIKIPATSQDDKAPTTSKKRGSLKNFFYSDVRVTVAARIQVFNPFDYLKYQEVEGLLYNYLEQEIRIFASGKQLLDLPKQKEKMTKHLENKLEVLAQEMGVNFIKIVVTAVQLPKNIETAGENLLVEQMERPRALYRADTLAAVTETLRNKYPKLNDRDLRNMVLADEDMATIQVFSFEGQGVLPVAPISTTGGKKKQ